MVRKNPLQKLPNRIHLKKERCILKRRDPTSCLGHTKLTQCIILNQETLFKHSYKTLNLLKGILIEYKSLEDVSST